MPEKPTNLEELLQQELPRLYPFAYNMCGERGEAQGHLREIVRDAGAKAEALLSDPNPSETLLGMLARRLEENLGRKADHTFESLDEILRSDITRPIDLADAGIDNDPGRVHVMLWELKRTCLTSTLGCLPPGVRLSFVLTDLLGFSPAKASDLLGIKESAYRVRLTRARKRIEDYLTPRCYHVDRQNPCTCTGRLGIAIDANFVKPPPHTEDIPHDPHDVDGPRRDMGSLYRGLPKITLLAPDLVQISKRG
jgi:RNA polymerase sigma-70 factor (ECF subfamily)